jgi:GNAT superfamily N-acetyltransferase
LLQFHPASVSEEANEDGPVAWVLMFPTTSALMDSFLLKEISEKQLFELTVAGASYDVIYLCSALVLEEFRRQGITRRLSDAAISRIREHHAIKALFVWIFSEEGRKSCEAISRCAGLPLYERVQ